MSWIAIKELIVLILSSPLFSSATLIALMGLITKRWIDNSDKRKEGNASLDKALKIFDSDNQRLRQELDSVKEALKSGEKKYDLMKDLINVMEQQLAELKAHNEILKEKVNLLESSHMKVPLPMWLKDREGRMLSLNKHYEEVFLAPMGLTAQDYIGKTDFDIWPEEVARKFVDNDNRAFATNNTQYTLEPVPGTNGEITEWIIVKYIRYIDNIAVGIAGMALPLDKFK